MVYSNKFGLKKITEGLGSFSKGKEQNIYSYENTNIIPLICYEIIFTELVQNITENKNMIINISEDGWFGQSAGPKQHFVHSLYRAIESGKYILRSANNGIAAVINPLGMIEKKVDFNESGYIDFNLFKKMKPTVFSRYKNRIFFLLILLYIFLTFSFNRIKNE